MASRPLLRRRRTSSLPAPAQTAHARNRRHAKRHDPACAQAQRDGAAAAFVMSAKQDKEFNLKPLPRIEAYANAGVDPSVRDVGLAPTSSPVSAACGLDSGRLGPDGDQ
ncbi:protein of unknown function [Burkholderia multivorans]